MWLEAWKLVSNDAKRTIPTPNAKHSTLLQGCFLCLDLKKQDFFSALDTSRPRQMIDIQYNITIIGGREVSRPYRVFRRRRVVFILLAMPPTSEEDGVGDVVWLIQASA